MSSQKVDCPSCSKSISFSFLNDHLDKCLSSGNQEEGKQEKRDENQVKVQKGDDKQSNLHPQSQSQPQPQSHSSSSSSSSTSSTLPQKTLLNLFDSPSGVKRTANDSSPISSTSSSQLNKKQRIESSSQSFISSPTRVTSGKEISTSGMSSSTSKKPVTFGSHTTTKSRLEAAAPLAERLRPRSLEKFIGQEEVINGPLKGMLSKGVIPSCILWGPPGTGKTTLARILTKTASEANPNKSMPPMRFVELSATTATTNDVKKVFDESLNRISLNGQRTVLFLDEIQRFNRAQQDIFLPALEKGQIILIGATTENPSFRLQGALLSRTRVFILQKLSVESCFQILKNARAKALQIGFGDQTDLDVSDEILNWIATMCDGDARSALSTFELALVTLQDSTASTEDRLEELKRALKRTSLNYDRSGDMHYDTISALHKSIRGSDANASMYWLARMISSGEDPLYIARRLIIAASEDVGTPEALQLSTNNYYAVSIIGLPEAAEPLAQTVLYLAEAKKSTRAYRALQKATKFVKEEFNHPVPFHIRNAPTKLTKEIGYGREYKYEPSFAHPVYQPFLPPEIKGARFVSPPPEEFESIGSGREEKEEEDLTVSTPETKGKGKAKALEREGLESKTGGLGLTRAMASGPGSCQRVFKIGARAVDLDLLEEWERERNGGEEWEGRWRLLKAIERREEEERSERLEKGKVND